MKKISKFMSVILTVALVASLFVTVNVSAAMQTVPLDWSDIVTYSFDITVPEGDVLGIEFTAPCNTASLANLGWSYGAGSIKIAGGKIQAGKHWLSSDNENIVNPCTDFPAGQANNLMVRKNHRTGYTEFIANGVSFCTTYVDNKTLPITMLNIHGSGAATSTITNVFTKGTDVGELGTVAEFDADNKKITIHFTEPLAAETDLSTTVLKNANNKEDDTLALTVSQFDGRTAIFTYDGSLSANEEYSVVLPEGLTGILGGTVKRYPKVTTDAVSVHQQCDYDDENATEIIKPESNNTGIVYDSKEEDHKNVMAFTTYQQTEENEGNYNDKIINLDVPESNIFTISYDAKLVNQDSIKMGWTLWQQGGKSVAIAYGVTNSGTNYTILQIDNKDLHAGWLGDLSWQTKIGEYKKDQWINYKLEFNRTEKTVKVYVGGVLKATKNIGGDVVAAGTNNTWRFQAVSNTAPTTVGTQFMWMDNIKVETIAEPTVVSEVAFVDGRGNKAGAGDTISRLLDKVNVKFSTEINESTLSTSTVKLLYNSTEVNYTPSYDASTRTYTLEPARLPEANAEVKIVVDGVYTNGDAGVEITPFEAVATADDEKEEFIIYEADAVDETDVKPINGNLTTSKFKYSKYYPIMRAANFTDADKQITLFAAEYTADGILNAVNVMDPVTLKSGEYIRYGGKLNGENVIQAKTDTSYIKVFAWDSITGGLHPMNIKPATVIKNY